MKLKLTAAVLVAAIVAPTVLPEAALARHYRNHHRYHGQVTYRNCSGGNGAVGTVAGGVGGAVIGNAVGGGTLGTVGGGVAGALLGRTLDKSNTRSRHGC